MIAGCWMVMPSDVKRADFTAMVKQYGVPVRSRRRTFWRDFWFVLDQQAAQHKAGDTVIVSLALKFKP